MYVLEKKKTAVATPVTIMSIKIESRLTSIPMDDWKPSIEIQGREE